MKFDGLLVPGILDVGNRDVVWTWDLGWNFLCCACTIAL